MGSAQVWLKMNELEKVEYINTLFDLYKELLTEKQKSIMEKYYSYNLSLKEISDELKISRAAVLDTIEHSIKKLNDYENKLRLHEKNQKLVADIEKSSLKEEEKQKLIDEVLYGIWSINRKIFKSNQKN